MEFNSHNKFPAHHQSRGADRKPDGERQVRMLPVLTSTAAQQPDEKATRTTSNEAPN